MHQKRHPISNYSMANISFSDILRFREDVEQKLLPDPRQYSTFSMSDCQAELVILEIYRSKIIEWMVYLSRVDVFNKVAFFEQLAALQGKIQEQILWLQYYLEEEKHAEEERKNAKENKKPEEEEDKKLQIIPF